MLKERARAAWVPEYRPESHVPRTAGLHAYTVTERATRVTLPMVMSANCTNLCAPPPPYTPTRLARCGGG